MATTIPTLPRGMAAYLTAFRHKRWLPCYLAQSCRRDCGAALPPAGIVRLPSNTAILRKDVASLRAMVR
jgi:hypothetical protein